MRVQHSGWHSFCFGDKDTCVEPDNIRGCVCPIPKDIPIEKLIFQHQVHGIIGHALTEHTIHLYEKSLVRESDYLITSIPKVGIGVLTADCLSVAVADTKKHVVGIAHAGWRGAVGRIMRTMLAHMRQLYGTCASDVQVLCGPCAHVCCYSVDDHFIQHLPDWACEAVTSHQQKNYFDLLLCVEHDLLSCGVLPTNINISLSKCTICSDNFCSYRKKTGITARQMSIIWIN